MVSFLPGGGREVYKNMNRKNIYIIGALILAALLLAGVYAVVQARELGRVEEEIYRTEEDNLRLEESLTELQEELEALERKNRELSQEKSHYLDRVGELEEGNRFLQEEIDIIEGQIEELEEEIGDLSAKVEDYRQQVRLLEEEKNRLARELEAKKEGDSPPPSRGEVAYLTFDDGPSPRTEEILDILKEYQVPATFFVIGNDSSFGRSMYRRMVEEGHALGNHTYTHNYSRVYQSPRDFMEDLYRLEDFLAEVVGVRPDIMRFPGGSRSASALEVAGYDVIGDIIPRLQEEGYTYFDWNVSAGDSASPPPSREELVDNVLGGARGKKEIVVLFHDSPDKENTVKALPEIIQGLKDMGYVFAVLKEGAPGVRFAR